jgi:DNA ligase (NAD+)
MVTERGGRVAASVTKGVDYLVLADASSTSSKAEKARKLGTQVIDEAAFDALVAARGG